MIVEYTVLGLSTIGLVWSGRKIVLGEDSVDPPILTDFLKSLPKKIEERLDDVKIDHEGVHFFFKGELPNMLERLFIRLLIRYISSKPSSESQRKIRKLKSSDACEIILEYDNPHESVFEPTE